MSALAKTGVLVHELCHVERDLKKNPLYRLVTTALTFILPTIETAIETRDERETDELVIAKGYGKELLEFQKYHDERYKDYTKKDGLTRKEIGTRIKRSKNGNKPRLD
jgi:DNA mismatch repair ATPase MutS